jgi:hypothetical protein
MRRPDSAKRIYLTRKESQHKRLVNAAAVQEWFADRGFEIYDPASLSFSEQLARVQGAEVLVAPEGSAPWLGFYGSPGTRIGLLDNPHVDEYWTYELLCRRLGLHLSILTGPVVRVEPSYAKFSDYEIDIERLPAFLDDLCSR